MDYTSPIAPFPSSTIVRALNVSNCTTRAGSNSIQEQTYILPSETVTNTVKHDKTCSFFQKPEYLQVVNHSAIAQISFNFTH